MSLKHFYGNNTCLGLCSNFRKFGWKHLICQKFCTYAERTSVLTGCGKFEHWREFSFIQKKLLRPNFLRCVWRNRRCPSTHFPPPLNPEFSYCEGIQQVETVILTIFVFTSNHVGIFRSYVELFKKEWLCGKILLFCDKMGSYLNNRREKRPTGLSVS